MLGGSGFIGAAIVQALHRHGYRPRCIVRRPEPFRARFPDADARTLDLASERASRAATWIPHVAGVHAVINAAGVLQPADAHASWAIHRDAPRALYAACRQASVGRIILVSAIGIDRTDTTFARARRAGEDVLRASGLRWTIVRPAVVVGPSSYGGTSLLRALAACPVQTPVPVAPDTPVSTIHRDDLAEGIVRLAGARAAAGQVLEAAAPGTRTIADVIAAYRRWLGRPALPILRIPAPLATAAALAGDALRLHPVTSTALAQARAGLTADGQAFEAAAGIAARPLDAALRGQPSGTQDLWHARLFLLRPLIRCTLALLWGISGALALASGTTQAALHAALDRAPWHEAAVAAAGVLDLAIAAALLRRWRPAATTLIQVAAIAGYTAALTWAAPALWAEPAGGLLKNLPVLLLVLVHHILEEER